MCGKGQVRSLASDIPADAPSILPAAAQLTMALEEEFGLEIPDAEADKIASLPDAISYLASHPAAR